MEQPVVKDAYSPPTKAPPAKYRDLGRYCHRDRIRLL